MYLASVRFFFLSRSVYQFSFGIHLRNIWSTITIQWPELRQRDVRQSPGNGGVDIGVAGQNWKEDRLIRKGIMKGMDIKDMNEGILSEKSECGGKYLKASFSAIVGIESIQNE